MTRRSATDREPPRRRSRLMLAVELAILVAVVTGAYGLLTQGNNTPMPTEPDPGNTVTINAATWRVELAVSGPDRYRGLSGRAGLAEDAGMLFVFPAPDVQDFCMRDCLIDLDIAFLDSDRRVVAIHTMKTEANRAGVVTYSSGKPAAYALEVRAGALASRGVTVGQQAEFSEDILGLIKAPPQR